MTMFEDVEEMRGEASNEGPTQDMLTSITCHAQLSEIDALHASRPAMPNSQGYTLFLGNLTEHNRTSISEYK